MRKLKIGLTATFKTNSLEISPIGNYNILVYEKLKGTIENTNTYKLGIYKGERVVIGKDKVYDKTIYLEGQTADEKLKINGTIYRGNFIIQVEKNKFKVINHIELEPYLYGVVGREIMHSWPFEAMRTKAVVARTFALQNLDKYKKQGFDLTDDDNSQMYGGFSSESEQIRKAVDKTKDEIIVLNNQIVPVFYHSCCGGFTENINNVWKTNSNTPHLAGRRCPYCKNAPVLNWTCELKFEDIKKTLEKNNYKMGNIKKLKIKSFTKAGRAKEISIIWNTGAFSMNANDFRQFFSSQIKSTKFKITNKKDSVYFVGKGFGHGVGLCQYGMKTMAEQGFSYKAILEYYFPKTGIKKWQDI